jgi:hypothetical protein
MPLITRAEKSSHWYHRDGTSCHEVIAKTTGLPRPTTVRDARKLDLIPSVTNILNMKAKPALMTWLQDNAILAALNTPQRPGEVEADWHSRIAEESDRIGKEAAEWGQAIHEQIEQFNTGGAFMGTGEILQYVEGYEVWHRANVDTVITAEQSVVGNGYAGRLDLYAFLKDGRAAVIDFKSQKLLGKPKANFYKEWPMQLAAYAECLENVDVMISIIICSDVPAPVQVKEWDNRGDAMRAFLACFELWCFEKGYRPACPTCGGC